MKRNLLALVAAAAALVGCGSEPGLGAGAARRMHDEVSAVRAAAAEADRDKALGALDELDRWVRQEQQGGRLAEEDAADLRERIAVAKRRVRRDVPAARPTSEAKAVPTATATPGGGGEEGGEPGKGSDAAKGKGETEGHGHDEGKKEGGEGGG